MSNIIPIVSSSPPPMEDGQSLGWGDDDDDDDFGNFASAPSVAFPSNNHEDTETPGFDVNWSHADSSAFQSASKDLSPPPVGVCERDASTPKEESIKNEGVLEENGKGSPYISGSAGSSSPSKSDSGPAEGSRVTESDTGLGADNDFNEEDDFADFASFQDESSNKNKPQVGSLPLQNRDCPEEDVLENHEDGQEKPIESVMEKSRESTTTDSGMFSTDISPLPKSESFSEGDKIVQSEDETFTELPQDTHQEIASPVGTGHSYLSDSESDAQKKEDSLDVSFDSRSNTPRNEDTTGNVEESSSKKEGQAEVLEDEEKQLCRELQADEQEETSVSEQVKDEAGISDTNLKQESDTSEGGVRNEVKDCSDSVRKTEVIGEAETAAEDPKGISTHIDSPVAVESSESSSNLPGDEIVEESDEWAAFETSHSTPTPPVPDTERSAHSSQAAEPEDLVLRTNSVEFDAEAACDVDEDFGEFGTTEDSIKSSDIPSKQSSPGSNTPGNQTPDERLGDDDFGDFSSKPQVHEIIPGEGATDETDDKEDKSECNKESSETESDSVNMPTSAATTQEKDDAEDFGNFSSDFTQSQKQEDDFGDFSSKEAAQDESEDDFGDFATKDASESKADEDFGDFSSKDATGDRPADDDDEDFGDFSSQPASSAAPATESKTDNFAAFSAKPAAGSDGEDDFGDFSSQSAPAFNTAEDSGWADFSGPSSSKAEAEEDDFGDFSDTKPTAVQDSAVTSESNTAAVDQGEKFRKALSSCFPGYSTPPPLLQEEAEDESTIAVDDSSAELSDVDKFGMLETILKYGLRFRSASLQTWQVVQHPSKKDPRVRLWGHLKDVDGSQAVVYQWAKSHTNSLLFNTLSIDTQNMLIGHKKVSVPIFATGLSLLEPIRGGERDRGLGMGGGGQLSKGAVTSSPAGPPPLVDPNQQTVEQPPQEIPAVDFDWSTSGLTNPLTSKSLDLDFLVVQDNDASEKPSVFQSEILDAPRSSVKSSRPLEDILKSVKPTSVRSRREDAATSQMSAEAARVLAGLPDLSFMHSKVLMFPIKN